MKVAPNSEQQSAANPVSGLSSIPWRRHATTLLALGLSLFTTQLAGQAQLPDALRYSRGYLVTGNFVVGGVDFPPGGGSGQILIGSATGNAVPADSDVVAAYLYWEDLTPQTQKVAPAYFRGQLVASAKASRLVSPPGGASCFGAVGSNVRNLTMLRADVLALLPKQYDTNNQWTGRYLANGAHNVSMGTPGGGNTLATVAGASLVIVYRNLSEPLRKIAFYDGVFAMEGGAMMSQTLRGFYGAAPDASARLTHIVGNGGNNQTETVRFNGVAVSASNPFPNPSNSADRGWANPTFNVGSLLSRNAASSTYGQIATTTVAHGNTSPNECLSWAGVIFSTAVADGDRDGLPDALESAQDGLKDPPTPRYPDGVPLPNLYAMGARAGTKDLFVEINAMTAGQGTKYGSESAPFRTNITDVTDDAGHDHMPNPAVLKMVGDAYKGGGIAVHFDVGDPAAYLNSFGNPDTNPTPSHPCDVDDCKGAGEYLIAAEHARGGERISERNCPTCQFKDFPGTLGWPYGFQVYGDAPVSEDGEELQTPAQLTGSPRERFQSFIRNWGDERRRRFDRNRDDYFRYAIFAHARGKAKSPLPCLDADGAPTMNGFEFNSATRTTACTGAYQPNPAFNVPTSASGVAQLPGNALLISLGLWDTEHFVGSTFVQASTLMHELGHTLNLWHGGKPAVFGNASAPTRVEPNCKSNYFSVMSYLFQVHGLFDAGGVPRIDYSHVAGETLRESGVSDGVQLLSGASQFTYRPAWFVPVGSTLFGERGATAARRYCNGAANPPPNAWARIQALTPDEPIQWDGEPGSGQYFTGPRDVNFDGVDDQVLDGYNDWTNLRLDQLGAGRRVQIVSNANGDLLDFASGDLLDFASGDLLDFASGDLLDFASGTHLLDMNSGAYIRYDAGDLLDFASGDLLDFASGDLLDFASGSLMTSGDGDLLDFASGDLLDFASGDLLDFASGDLIDFGSGDLLDFASGDLIDFGSGDLLDFASGDLIDFGSGTGQEEMTFDLAMAMERPRPHGVTVCVLGVDCADSVAVGADNYHRAKLSWRAPTFGEVQNYQVYRYYSPDNPSGFSAFATVPQNQFVYIGSTADGQTREFIDQEELPAGVRFAYYVRALLTDDTLSNNSDLALYQGDRYITAMNDTPVAASDSGAEAFEGDPGVVIDVLANDTDTDSLPAESNTRLTPGTTSPPATFAARAGLRVVITQDPGYGTAVVNTDGTVTYTPNLDYAGGSTDTFKYKVNNGTWNEIPLSADSDEVTVTVTVRSRHTATVVTISPASPTYGDSITFQANVIPHSNLGALASTSTVTFREGATVLAANVPLQDGAFIFSTSSLTAGPHTITAEFCGGSTHPHVLCGQYYGSSGSASFTIERASSSTVVSCPASVTYTGAPRTPCSAMTTGAGGLSQSTTVTYSNNTNVGTATANATYAGDANHTGSSGSATFAIDVYRFVNVQNMPAPAGKAFASISTIPLQWQWATATGEVLNTQSVVPRMMAYACSNLGQKLPGGYPVGEFSSLNPGLGNSFSYSETTNTWQFNWKLHYRAADRKYYGLPTGNYVIAVVDLAMSTFRYPATTNTCDGGLQIVGALVVVK
ncbi:MAG: Ig-like domain repeat protein [Acidobacteriota bacterium]|nr:Ig-like domain repeat protein [Acidobacteriota bacterium]